MVVRIDHTTPLMNPIRHDYGFAYPVKVTTCERIAIEAPKITIKTQKITLTSIDNLEECVLNLLQRIQVLEEILIDSQRPAEILIEL